jgi:DNA transposition AAA+ family ATPase
MNQQRFWVVTRMKADGTSLREIASSSATGKTTAANNWYRISGVD